MSTIVSDTDQQFSQQIRQEAECFGQFLEILQSEHEALQKSDIDHLIALAQLKAEKLETLGRYSESRSQFLAQRKLPADQRGMEQWLRMTPSESETARQHWTQLLDLARKAQKLNQENGAVIDTKLRHNQQALMILQAVANQANLYGPDGKTQASAAKRPIGKV